MPTPRQHGGAGLLHVPLNVPGYMGLNTELRGSVLGPEWATRLQNTVFDDANRIASRKGWAPLNASALTGKIVQLHEDVNATSGNTLWAITDDNKIWRSTDEGSTFTDQTGTATVTDPNMQIVSFRGVVLGFQDGTGPVILSAASSNLGATGQPDKDVALAAFGRVWAKSSPTTVQYSALLDETDWTGSDTGVIDLTSVWPSADSITAITAFAGNLVIFSKRHIVIFNDGTGSALGLDPVNASVVELISGIGCVARDSVQNVKGDLWFLDDTGVHSLGRLINNETNPIDNITKNVQALMQEQILSTTPDKIRATYSPTDRFYLISFPQGTGTEVGSTYCIDTRAAAPDGSMRIAGIWSKLVPRALVTTDSRNVLVALEEKTGKVGSYSGFNDDTSSYVMDYESGWNDIGDSYLKVLKNIEGILFVSNTISVTFKWAFDFLDNFDTGDVVYTSAGGTGAYWGTGEWGSATWGGGVSLQEDGTPATGTGEHIKIGMSTNIDGESVSVQQISLYAKHGRLGTK